MKIAVICDILGEKNNGTTIALRNLIDFLASRGHEVRVICHDTDNKKNQYSVKEINIPIITSIFHLNGVEVALPNKKILNDAIIDCDVVHLELPFLMARMALKIAKKYKKPVTASFHCQAENLTAHLFLKDAEFINKLVYRNFYKNVYSKVDAVHYPTEFIRNVFENSTGKTNGYVISNGVNSIFKPKIVDKPAELNNKFIILYIGRLSSEKNHSVLLHAVQKSKYKDKIHLIFAGDGPKKKSLLKLAKKLNIDLEINFYTREKLVDIINYSDLYCHPAEVELESIACLEAISCGLTPIIANSKKCATKYFALSDKCLFKNKDSVDLASKIDYFFENDAERINLGKRYAIEGQGHEHTECMIKMEQMFKDVINLNNKKYTKNEKENLLL